MCMLCSAFSPCLPRLRLHPHSLVITFTVASPHVHALATTTTTPRHPRACLRHTSILAPAFNTHTHASMHVHSFDLCMVYIV
ncbi:hypothetical protein DFH94DRAFT_498849 [Russula ochroleuca]|uniref:Uncharacterized protein n=1 Tax=Russula ochroleuca TaxID=152965 RepID=A0A9P5MVU6_9AGAM|nr:hypothetical protein DFH94DRAFT_498849 [Russula ochroleuca]